MANPLISVLMSVHNSEKYLGVAIESILNQTFNSFEFIIINDGSKDSSKDIILSYNDKRIKYFENNKNIGLTKSLNKGIKLAKGCYIARMDADDLSLPTRLEQQYNFLENNLGLGACGCWANIIDENGKKISDLKYPSSYEGVFVESFFLNPIIHGTSMIRKDALYNIGFYNDDFTKAQDYELWIRFLINNIKLSNASEILYSLRNHDASITSSQFESQESFARQIICYAYKEILKIDINKKYIDAYRKLLIHGAGVLNILDNFKIRLLLSILSRHIKKKIDNKEIISAMKDKIGKIAKLL